MLCGQDVSDVSQHRKTSGVLKELEDVHVVACLGGMPLDSQEHYLCRKCFATMEKRVKLKADLA